jgi:hypothetical protein
MAATTRMRSPQEEHSSGSESQVRAMRRAQLRLRFRRNSPSSSSSRGGRRVGVVVAGVGGEGGSDGEVDGGSERGGGWWTGGFSIQPAFFRNVVERAP